VLHLLRPPGGGVQRPTQVGFVVSRGVGNSVVRHRVQRRLRHLLRERLDEMPAGSQVVVRALAPAAGASYAELGADVDRCLLRVLGDRPGSRQGERPVHGQGSVS